MGEVYRARHAAGTGRRHQDPLGAFGDHPARLARLEREARVLASLNHPHIGAIFGLEESDGIKALVLEVVEGDDSRAADRPRAHRSLRRCLSRSRSPMLSKPRTSKASSTAI